MLRRIFLSAFFILITYNAYSQTSEAGNYELYSRELGNSSFGYFYSKVRLPVMYGALGLTQSGIAYTNFYDLGKVGSIPLDSDNEIGFYFNGEFKIGFAAGEKVIIPGFPVYNNVVKFYSATFDAFSLYFTPEYTMVMSNGNAVIFKLGINLLNIGGTVALPENGVVKKHMLATVNFVPIGFAPTVFFDFGRSGLGLRAYFNLNDIVSYNFAPSAVYGREYKGIKAFDSVIRRMDFQIVFVF
jgi:hypothetical protein